MLLFCFGLFYVCKNDEILIYLFLINLDFNDIEVSFDFNAVLLTANIFYFFSLNVVLIMLTSILFNSDGCHIWLSCHMDVISGIELRIS